MKNAYNNYIIGKEVKIKPNRHSSQGHKFEYYLQPFKVKRKKNFNNKKYCGLTIVDDSGVEFEAWSDAFLPNIEESEFKVHW